uniref:Uncharacterized protein n=1 Tax=Anguilla anguilla TaxID=7936 RepID=A0A0E9RHP8_ANGAN
MLLPASIDYFNVSFWHLCSWLEIAVRNEYYTLLKLCFVVVQ